VSLEDGVDVVVAATLGEPVADPRALWEREAKRRSEAAEARAAGVRGVVSIGADAFLYRANDQRLGVVAGYPWFLEWGRDTFLSLPGLLLARERVDECGEALAGALAYLRRGLMPNIFGLTPETSAYNSVDASLWFARCVRLYEQAGAPTKEIVERFLPALREIAKAYRDGTDLGIRCDSSGLIVAGGPHLNATWMDARLPSGPVTPRDGCAVEIQALWYLLLAYLEHLETFAGKPDAARAWSAAKTRAGAAFLDRFWLEKEARLADVWRDGVVDRSVRPNMVIAAALEWSPLSREQRADIVTCARAELVTPRGLRTLRPRDTDYIGRYGGNTEERDRAYHQGTVWPWLVGFYVEAALRSQAVPAAELRELLDGFEEHLSSAGLGHISEVFDGDPPHRAGGTIAQAWSEAEWLRADRLLREHAT
jgi:predicted glycogen debranching enzyme